MRWFLPSLAFLVAMAPFAGLRAAPAPPKIHVFSCQVMSGTLVPRKDDVGLAVRFRNDGPESLGSIVWRAKYGDGTVDFIDDGTFSPGLRIDNFVLAEQGSTHFNWGGLAQSVIQVMAHGIPTGEVMKTNLVLPQYASTSEPENCSVLRATFESGETWVNPDLAQQTAMLTAPTPVPAARALPAAEHDALEPVDFAHCALMTGSRSFLEVSFRNVSTHAADRIVVRARYRESGIDFTDEGTFAPDVLVKHVLKKPTDELRDQSSYSLDTPRDCAIVSVHYADGATWQSASIGATPGPLPTAPPDGFRIGRGTFRWAPRHGFPTPLPSPSESPAIAPSPGAAASSSGG